MAAAAAVTAATTKRTTKYPALPRSVLIVGATGGLGSRVSQSALEAGHRVSVLVRSQDKLDRVFGYENVAALSKTTIGSVTDASAVANACTGVDTVIECLGNQDREAGIDVLIRTIGSFPAESQPAFIALGGSPALLLSEDGTPATAHERIAPMAGLAKMHLQTLSKLKESPIIHWAQICPARMTPSVNGKPSGEFMARPNIIDMRVYETGTPLFYEDVAATMVEIADVATSGYSSQQVAFALR